MPNVNLRRAKAPPKSKCLTGATEKMAKRIAEGITDSGVGVKLFDVAATDRTETISEMLDAKGFILGSSTHDNDMLPTMAGFLEFLKGLKPKNRIAAAFGSFGWAGGAVASIEKSLQETPIEIAQPSISVKFMPDESEIKKCYEFGAAFAKTIKA